MVGKVKRSFARYDMQDMKRVVEPKPSVFWQALSSVGWGCAAGAILAAFVILTLHLGR